MSRRSALLGSCGFFLLSMVSCSDDDFTLGPSSPDDPTPPRLSDPSAPESLLYNIEVLYNDRQRNVSDRLARYDELFSRDFIFRFPPPDIFGPPASWGIKTEVEAHRGMFTAQDEGGIYSLSLHMIYDPAQDLAPAQPGREGWKMIFVTLAHIRVMSSPEDGAAFMGQAEFLFPPPVDGRWTIGEWSDLPRPTPARADGRASSWGELKAKFLP